MSIAPPGWETPPASPEPDPVGREDAHAEGGVAKATDAVAGPEGVLAAAQAVIDKITDAVEGVTGASAKPRPGALGPKEPVARVKESFARAKRSTLNPSARTGRPWYLTRSWIAGFVVLALLAAGGSPSGSSESRPAAPAAQAPDVAQSGPVDEPVVTVGNSAQFAALLKMDSCDGRLGAFAAENAGRTIQFDGSIANMAIHGNDSTRYDILIAPGNKGPNSTIGPAFKFEDVNVVSDLHYTGRRPEVVGVGDRFRFAAAVAEYDRKQCLFFLDPVSTRVR